MKVAIYQRDSTTVENMEPRIQDRKATLPEGYVPVAVFMDLDCESTNSSAFSRAWSFVNQGYAEALYIVPVYLGDSPGNGTARMEETAPTLLFPTGKLLEPHIGLDDEDH